MPTPILLVARLRMFIAGWSFFPIRHHRQTIGIDTEFNKVIPGSFRPFFTEDKVVGGGPALVTVPFDLNLHARIGLYPLGIASQRLTPIF